MSFPLNGLFKFRWQPQLQQLRYKNKINISKPRPPHFRRAVVEQVCLPYFSLDKKAQHVPKYESCIENMEIIKKEQENPLEIILGREVVNWFNHSKLIAIFHENCMDEEERFETAVLLKKNGLKLLQYGKQTMRSGLTGTIYEPILQFYCSHTKVAVCKEPNLHILVQICKNIRGLILLAAIVNNNKLLSYSEIEKYGKIKNIETARLNLLSVLNTASQNLVQHLNHHPNSLLQRLKQIQQGQDKEVRKNV